ncbi:MAG: tetratricopeptide repeat protein [Bacteroidales bacterium]|nr:tetratricopeptide repeat protein [Bacteroidales bacterium]
MRNFHKIILTLFTLVFALSVSTAKAQDTEQTAKKRTVFQQHLYVNGNLGINTLWGDITDKKDLLLEPEFGFGLNVGYQYSPIIGARLNMTSGKTKSTLDHLLYDGGFTDLSAQLTVDLTNLLYKDNNNKLNLYGFGGFGIMFYNGDAVIPMGYDNYAVFPGSYKSTAMVFPAGLGFKYNVTENLDVTVEGSFHYSSTDKLEGMSGEDANGKQPFYTMDAVKYASVGLTYKFVGASAIGILGGSGASKMIRNHETVSYKVTPAILQEKGNKVPYEVSVTFPANYFGQLAAVKVAPVLKYGDQEFALASQVFIGEKVIAKGQKVPYLTGGTYTFKGEFDYTPEMANSTVVVTPVIFTPKDNVTADFKNLGLDQIKLADGIIHTENFAGGNEEVLMADAGYKEVSIVNKSAKLFFPKNLFTYNKRSGLNNTETATAARNAVNSFLAQGWEIKNITINAYASPEGEESFNASLSENRAKVADKYIHTELLGLIKAKDSKIKMKDCSGVNFSVTGNGPDWNGFMIALESSSIAGKSTILNVIKSAAPSKKEEEIRNMILMYPELEKILSPLRRAKIVVNASEPKRSNEEIAALAITSPKDLTLEELLFAATLTNDKGAQAGIYKTAVDLFSNSYEANTNFATSEIQKGNLSNALTYLQKANTLSPNNPTVLNDMGVIYAKQGDWEKAKKYFTNAKNLGANENYNLGVVAIQYGEYDNALSLFGSRKCDVNVGLAQLMTGKYESAKANLSCAVETCKTNYLLAVVGARTEKDAEVFASLKKAFAINPKLKGSALNDREFIRYFENAEFLALIK